MFLFHLWIDNSPLTVKARIRMWITYSWLLWQSVIVMRALGTPATNSFDNGRQGHFSNSEEIDTWSYWVQVQYCKKAYIASREKRFTTTGIANKAVRVTHRGRPVLRFSLVLLVLTLSRTCHSVRRPSHRPQRYPYVNPSVHCKTLPCICGGIQFYSSQPQNSVKHSFSLFSFYKKVLTRSRLYQFSRSSGLSRSHWCSKMLGRPPNWNDLGSENASFLLSATWKVTTR